jgi:hypothetical protein
MSESGLEDVPSGGERHSVRAKTTGIFREWIGERAELFCNDLCDGTFAHFVASQLVDEDEIGEERAREIAFHLSDWHADAAFIVALHLFPERFTSEEIRKGVLAFLIHAPNHVAAAAALSGHPVQDTFEVGALDGPTEEDDSGSAA